MEPTAMPKHFLPQDLVIFNTVIDVHTQSTEHNADKTKETLAVSTLKAHELLSNPPVLVPAI